MSRSRRAGERQIGELQARPAVVIGASAGSSLPNSTASQAFRRGEEISITRALQRARFERWDAVRVRAGPSDASARGPAAAGHPQAA